MNLKDLGLISTKQNFLIFIAALTGQEIAREYFFTPESGVSVITAAAAVVGFNIGNIIAKKISPGHEYDERNYKNLDEGLAWGFIVAASLLGVDLAKGFAWGKAEILIISASAAVLVMIYRNFRQTGDTWKRFVNGWRQRIGG
ncbi:MAG: hypothetical protein ABEJ36_01190 [Candidatus Nanosalina sp.]